MGDSKLNVEALDKLIMSFHDQSILLSELQHAQVALTDTCRTLANKLSDVVEQLAVAQQHISEMQTELSGISNKQKLMILDTEADHQMYSHRADVVSDWREEHIANFNSDEIPYADVEIKSGMENMRRKRLDAAGRRRGHQ